MMITQKQLKQSLSYDPLTGVFIRLISNSNRSQAGAVCGTVLTNQDGKSYIRIGLNGKYHYGHRLAWLYVKGLFPKDQIDHEDGDGLNNKFSNLRNVTNSENGKNARLPTHNTSGSIGVNKMKGKWRAEIKVNQKHIHLGLFLLKRDAISARKNAEIKYGFHKNHGSVRPL